MVNFIFYFIFVALQKDLYSFDLYSLSGCF
jgi:hypothetical protein